MNPVINYLIRGLLLITGILLLMLCGGLWLNQPEVIALWPWPDGRLSYIFVASILAAIAAPVIWMGLSGELAMMRGGALDFAVTYLGLSITLIIAGTAAAELVAMPLSLQLTGAACVFNLLLFWWVRNIPVQDKRPMPGLVRVSFLVFTLLLILVGTALIMRYPAVFPWPLKPQSSIVFGWIFMGAAMYFLYGFLRPHWSNACGQLLGFLAYDLILLPPFLQHLDSVKTEHQLSLWVYTSILVYSALLAIYFLFMHRETRFKREPD